MNLILFTPELILFLGSLLVFAIAAAVAFALYAVYARLVVGQVPEGFTASLLIMTFLSGTQLLFLGAIGEYLGRVYGEAKGRPQYVVAKISGAD